MKKLFIISTAIIVVGALVAASYVNNNPYHLTKGNPGVKSISALTFGPDGLLFIGDSRSAAIHAIDTRDKTKTDNPPAIELKNIDQKIAASLGTEVKNIRIQDIAVNPLSKKIYCAVQYVDGTPVLLTLDKDRIQSVNLKDIAFSSVSIANVPGEDQKDRGGRSLRESVISDLHFAEGMVMVSGISNQEFSSTFRRIAFPFNDKQEQASLEIFHAAHGKYETAAPIRTFTTGKLNGKHYLIASYTCTPLVLFPSDELKAGKHVKGRTVAEFGAGNSPIDMITVQKGENTFLLMANTNRPLMKVKYQNIENFAGSLTEPIKESFGTAGVNFVSLPVVNVLQMDKLDDSKVIVLQRRSNGDLDLITLNEWLLS